MISKRAHLPLFCILVFWVRNIRNFFVIALFLLFKLTKDDPSYLVMIGGVVSFLLLFLVFAIWSYSSFTYQIDATSITVNKGIFNKKQTILPFERIQTINANHLFYLRPFKLARLTLESAAGTSGEAEIIFPVLPTSVIASIETVKETASHQPSLTESTIRPDAVKEQSPNAPSTEIEPVNAFTLALKEIFLFSLTDFSLLAIFVVIGFNVIDKLPDLFSLTNEIAKFGLLIGGVILLGVLVLFMLLSLAINLLRYYGFKVEQQGEQLRITQGLFSKQQRTIPLSKIQGLSVEQNIYRRIFRLSTVKLLLATGSSSEGEHTVFLFPIMKDDLLLESLQRFLPEWSFQQPRFITNSHPTLWYFYRWPLLIGLLASGVTAYFFWWLAVLLLLVCGSFMVSGIWRGKMQGYQFLSDDVLLCQSIRGLTKVTAYLAKNKIQDFSLTTTYWQYQKGLGKSQFTIKTGDTETESKLLYFPLAEAERLRQWFLS
jgi:putative membrane protein